MDNYKVRHLGGFFFIFFPGNKNKIHIDIGCITVYNTVTVLSVIVQLVINRLGDDYEGNKNSINANKYNNFKDIEGCFTKALQSHINILCE